MVRERLSREVRRQQILDAAIDCFCSKGYHGASISDIVEASGTSKGNVYWYFASKEEIFLAVVEMWAERALRDLAEDLQEKGGSFESLADKIVDRLLRYMNQERAFLLAWTEFATAASRDDEVRSRMISIARKFQRELSPFLSAGVERGELKDVDLSALSNILKVVHDGILFNGIIWPEKFARRKNVESMIRLVVELLRAEPSKDAREG
ncbi:MAG: TetR/AcrR family transcriptional regulator [bacterium]